MNYICDHFIFMATNYNIKIISTSKNSWTHFVNRNRYERAKVQNQDLKTLVVDFSKCTFMEPFHVVSLACLVEEYFINGVEIGFIPGGLELMEYLQDINFINFWGSNRNVSEYIPAERKSALSLWKISEEMVSSYANQAKLYFEQNYIQDKDLFPLATALSELFMNIFDHSKSSVSGFCLTQYYPHSGKIKFSVCDFGIGIPTSINRYFNENNLPIKSDLECLVKAFELSFTTRSTPRNRGFGLDTINSIIEGNKGVLRLVSNRGCIEMSEQPKSFQPRESFNGTHFEIVLNVENLTAKSTETEDFDFDF